MKAFLIASTILFSTAAMAQDMGQAPTAQPMQSDTAPATPDAGMTPPADGSMTPPPAGGAMQPGMDQQGMGQPGMQPPGAPAPAANSMGGGAPMANAPAAGDPSTYPMCSRTVKDRCKNRGGR